MRMKEVLGKRKHVHALPFPLPLWHNASPVGSRSDWIKMHVRRHLAKLVGDEGRVRAWVACCGRRKKWKGRQFCGDISRFPLSPANFSAAQERTEMERTTPPTPFIFCWPRQLDEEMIGGLLWQRSKLEEGMMTKMREGYVADVGGWCPFHP